MIGDFEERQLAFVIQNVYREITTYQAGDYTKMQDYQNITAQREFYFFRLLDPQSVEKVTSENNYIH